MNWEDKRVIVFGGGGFLGSYIIDQLLSLGCGSISSFSRSDQPELRAKGVVVVQGDIRDPNSVKLACENCDVVFLTAAKAGVWGSWKDYYDINVIGARNVINSCLENNIRSLVYTSSPSVAYSAEVDVIDMNEQNPYPVNYLAHYPKSKAIAEQDVLSANCDKLKTVAIRPHLIWGPRDPHLIPRVIQAARSGKLRIVGNGDNIVDMTYVVNAAAAHISAAEVLCDQDKCAQAEGKAYFISDDSPVNLWNWTNNLLDKCGVEKLSKKISYNKAFKIGRFLELVYKMLPFLGEPPMTRFIAGQFSHSHWFDISAAKNDLGYKIVITPEEGLEKLLQTIEK